MTFKGRFLLILAIFLKGSLAELKYIEADNCYEYNSWDYNLTARQHQCNDTFPLHCFQLQNREKFALRCLKAKNCTQGQQPFIPSDASDTVLCKSCQGNTYNSDYSKPSNSYSSCTPMTALENGRILCEHLKSKTSDPEYNNHNHYMRCNTSENYVLDNGSVSYPERDIKGYCSNETKLRCIKYQCKEGKELIKDYSCVNKCRSDEYRADNLTCVKHQTGPSTTLGPLTTPGHVTDVVRKESSPQPAPPTVTQATEPTKNESTDDTKKKGVDVGVSVDVFIRLVTGIGIGICLIVGFIVGPIARKKRDRIRAYCQKQKDRIRAYCQKQKADIGQGDHTTDAQPNTTTDDSGDSSESSPLFSEVQREHAAQPNQAEDPPDSSGEESADQQPIEKRPCDQHFKINGANIYIKQVTKNYIYTDRETTRPKTTNKKASQKNGDSDGDRSHNKYSQPETGADNQGSQQPNTDNGVSLDTLAKYPHLETGAGDQRSHPPYIYIGVREDPLEPCPRTFGDLKDKLQRAISWEETVDVILDHFGQLPNERNSWNMFCNYCNFIHENVFLKNLLPSLPLSHVPFRPNSPEKKYRNTPEGFTAFESSGRHNSCLYQSVSLLLVGDESLFKLLRVTAAVFAARHFEIIAKQIREHLKYEHLDVDLYYRRHLTDKAFERHKDERNAEEQNKKYLQELIMETPILNAMSSQIHAMFLCGAIGRPIHQHLLPQHEHYRHMFLEQLDPKACFSNEVYDEKLPKLHIMWVNNEDNPDKEINHVVPLWKEKEEMYHPVTRMYSIQGQYDYPRGQKT